MEKGIILETEIIISPDYFFRTLGEMISAGNYYYVSEAIRAGYFSLPSKPTKTLLAKLFYYDCSTKKMTLLKK